MENQQTDITPGKLLDEIGRDEVRGKLFGPADGEKKPGGKAISQALWKRQFPSAWYAVIKKLCDEKQVDCPQRLFAFREEHYVPDAKKAVS